MKFFIMDAFTSTLFGGNPAGVVLLPEGSDFPSDDVMVKTAAELRYSETAFIKSLGELNFQVRYFTPAAEVDLCGHATIGSFAALQYAGLIKAGDVCKCHALAGDLSIEVSEGFVMMDMATPELISTIDDENDIAELCRVMGTEPEEIYARSIAGEKTRLLPRLVSTGLPDIMMPFASRESLNATTPDMKALSELSARYNVTGVHAFTLDSAEGVTAHARNFAPLVEIDEEAATGTSNGALTYYLYTSGIISGDADCCIIQGESMGRPSEIRTKISADDSACNITVGGSAVVLAEGEINL